MQRIFMYVCLHWVPFTNWIFSAMVCFHFGHIVSFYFYRIVAETLVWSVPMHKHNYRLYRLWSYGGKSVCNKWDSTIASGTGTHTYTPKYKCIKPLTEIASRVNGIVSVPVYFQRTHLSSCYLVRAHRISFCLFRSLSPEWNGKWKMKTELKCKIRSTKCF